MQKFWKILERPGLCKFGKSVCHNDNTRTTGARISQGQQKTGIFLNIVLLPVLYSDVACGVKLFRGCHPSPESCKDHAGSWHIQKMQADRTRQEHAELCSLLLAPTQHGEDPPHCLPRLSWPLLPVWQQRNSLIMAGHFFPAGNSSPLLTMWPSMLYPQLSPGPSTHTSQLQLPQQRSQDKSLAPERTLPSDWHV